MEDSVVSTPLVLSSSNATFNCPISTNLSSYSAIPTGNIGYVVNDAGTNVNAITSILNSITLNRGLYLVTSEIKLTCSVAGAMNPKFNLIVGTSGGTLASTYGASYHMLKSNIVVADIMILPFSCVVSVNTDATTYSIQNASTIVGGTYAITGNISCVKLL
jgi:hypothetical protein